MSDVQSCTPTVCKWMLLVIVVPLCLPSGDKTVNEERADAGVFS